MYGPYCKPSADYWVVKLDEDGNKVWDKTLGGTGDDYLASVVEVPGKGYLIGGYSNSGIGGDKSEATEVNQRTDYWIVKISDEGAKQWDKTFGGSDYDQLVDMLYVPNSGFLLAGVSTSGVSGDKTQAGCGGSDIWIVRTDEEGAKLWDKSLGGCGGEILPSIVASPDGGFLLSAVSSSGIGGDKSENNIDARDFWVIKMDGEGTKIWDRTYGSTEEFQMHLYMGRTIATQEGGYLLIGSTTAGADGDKTEPSQGGDDYWIIRISEDGTKQWDKRFGGNQDDVLTDVVQDADGEYLLGGDSRSGISGDKTKDTRQNGYEPEFWLVKTTPDTPPVLPQVTGFTLFNADTDEDIQTLNEGDVLDLAKLPTANLNIRANVSPATVGSVVFQFNKLPRHIENHAYYSLFANSGNDYNAGLLPMGQNTLKATPYANTYGKGSAGGAHTVQFTVVGSRAHRLVLVNADTDQDVMELPNEGIIDYAVLGTRNINIRAETYPATVGSVVFRLNGELIRRENILPYALGGDNYPDVGDYHTYPLPLGENTQNTLEVTSYSGRNGTGEMGGTLAVTFYVHDGAYSAGLATIAVDGEGSRFGVFPNPFTDKLTVQTGTEDGPVQATLVDQLGRTVYQKEFAQPAGAVEVDVSGANLKAGIYFLRLQTASTGTKVMKLMKQ